MYMRSDGRVAFVPNSIVRDLLDFSQARGFGLNEIACAHQYSREERCQLAQLIGYSLEGFHELYFVYDKAAAEATHAARQIDPAASGCRDDNCPIHSDGAQADIAKAIHSIPYNRKRKKASVR